MPEFAHHVAIGKDGLYLDGEEFPWYVSDEGISVVPIQHHVRRARRHEVTGITEIHVRILVDGPVNIDWMKPEPADE
jgi:hypothetical protein